jgi:hypothetical protein
MAKTYEAKAADALIDGCSRYDWNPWLFIGTIMLAPTSTHGRIMETLVKLFQDYQVYASDPDLQFRVSGDGWDQVQKVDLTEFDQ